MKFKPLYTNVYVATFTNHFFFLEKKEKLREIGNS